MWFSGFLFLILSVIVEVYLWWITGPYHLFKWENLHNKLNTKYFFSPTVHLRTYKAAQITLKVDCQVSWELIQDRHERTPKGDLDMWRMKGVLLRDDVRHKDNLLILPKSLFRVGKVVTWAEPGIKGGMGKLCSRTGCGPLDIYIYIYFKLANK